MKARSLFLILCVTALLFQACGGGKYDRSTPEALGKSVVKVIAAQDKEGLRELVPTKSDFKTAVEKSDMPEERRKEVMERFDKEWAELEKEMEEEVFGEFDEMIKEAAEEGIDLSTATFKDVKVKGPEMDDGFEMADVFVLMTIDGEEFELKMRECGKMESGWVMSPEGFRIREAR